MSNTINWSITQPCNGIGTGVSLPIFGGFAMLPSVVAGIAGYAVRERHADAAMTAQKLNPGTQVWSPPT